MVCKAPFPWFGGKSRAVHVIWPRFGQVRNYVEPFFGSGAILFNRPQESFHTTCQNIETIYSGPQKVDHSGQLHLLRPFPFQPP